MNGLRSLEKKRYLPSGVKREFFFGNGVDGMSQVTSRRPLAILVVADVKVAARIRLTAARHFFGTMRIWWLARSDRAEHERLFIRRDEGLIIVEF